MATPVSFVTDRLERSIVINASRPRVRGSFTRMETSSAMARCNNPALPELAPVFLALGDKLSVANRSMPWAS